MPGDPPLVDIGVLSPEEFGDPAQRTPPAARGVVRLLQEGARQFDILDSHSDLSGYRVLVLPDEIDTSDRQFRDRLLAFMGKGGALLASHRSCAGDLGARLGFKVKGDAAYSPDYLRARPKLGKGLPDSELVMYTRGVELVPTGGAQVLADVVAPYFNRTWQHFFSHRHTPSSGKVVYPGVVQRGRAIGFAHPVFSQYAKNAPRWCKTLVLNALDLLLPEPILRVRGPSTLLTAVNEQARERRWVVHLLHYVPERRGDDFDVIEDVIPVHDVGVSVRMPRAPRAVALVPEGKPLPFEFKNGRAQFTIPTIEGHQMVALDV